MNGAHPDEWKAIADAGACLSVCRLAGNGISIGLTVGDSTGRIVEIFDEPKHGQIEQIIAMMVRGFYLSVKFPNQSARDGHNAKRLSEETR